MKFNYSSANIAVTLDRAGGPPFLHLDDSGFVGLVPIKVYFQNGQALVP